MNSGLIAQLRPLIHPMLVHFPIALLFASVALDWLGYWLKHSNLTRAGFYTLVLGAMGAGLAALSGPDHAIGDASVPYLLASHQTFASLTVILAVALVAWRFLATRGVSGLGAYAYLLATLFLLAFVSVTGYYGGEMAYHHAVGISAPNVLPATGGDAVSVRALLPAKPITALVGFLSVVGFAFWVLLGRRFFPRAAGAWWQAVRQEWSLPSSPLWTLRRGATQSAVAPVPAHGAAHGAMHGIPRGTPHGRPAAPVARPAAHQPGFAQPAPPSGYPQGYPQGYSQAYPPGYTPGANQAPGGRMPGGQPGQPPQAQPRYNPPYGPDDQPRR